MIYDTKYHRNNTHPDAAAKITLYILAFITYLVLSSAILEHSNCIYYVFYSAGQHFFLFHLECFPLELFFEDFVVRICTPDDRIHLFVSIGQTYVSHRPRMVNIY